MMKKQDLKNTKIGRPKLDEVQVAKIRDLLKEGKLTYSQIGEIFGCSSANIKVINDGKTWTHVNGGSSKIRAKRRGTTKLDEAQVLKIRDLLAEGEFTLTEIGEMFDVSYSRIRDINNGKIWTHIEGIGTKIKTRGLGNTKLTQKQVIEIKDLLFRGNLTQKEIGEMFGVTRSTIGYINQEQSWKHIEQKELKNKNKK